MVVGIPITNSSAWITWLELGVLVLILAALLVFSPRRQLVFRAAVFFLACFLVNLGQCSTASAESSGRAALPSRYSTTSTPSSRWAWPSASSAATGYGRAVHR